MRVRTDVVARLGARGYPSSPRAASATRGRSRSQLAGSPVRREDPGREGPQVIRTAS